jgi:hypothetical protein
MTVTNRLLPAMAKGEQPRDDQRTFGGSRFVAVFDSGVRCLYVEEDGTSCKRQADTRGCCKMHYRRLMHRERGLKRHGRYRDLTRTWGGPRADLYVDHEEFPDGDPTKDWPNHRAHWLVFHGLERGGCGGSGIMNTDAIKQGDCPAACRKSARFKAQTTRKAAGETGRLFPLTDQGREAITETVRARNEAAGPGGVIGTLPRTRTGRVLKRSSRRGYGTSAGRERDYIGDPAERNAARQRASRERKRAAKTGDSTPRQYDGVVTVLRAGKDGRLQAEVASRSAT